jgi:hypothetical protein
MQVPLDALLPRRCQFLENSLDRFGRCRGFVPERRNGCRPFDTHPVAPAFSTHEEAPFPLQVLRTIDKEGPDRAGIDFPHEFANQLFLPAHRTMRLHAAQLDECIVQPFVEPKSLERLIGQSGKLFAERLQLELFPLARAFAGFWIGHRLSYPPSKKPVTLARRTGENDE